MVRYHLQSTPMVCAPGVIDYARRVYQEGNASVARQIVNAWPGLPAAIVDGLLNGTLTTEIDADEALIVTTPDDTPMAIANQQEGGAS